MILRLIGFAIVLSVPAWLVGHAVYAVAVRPLLRARAARRAGRLNAEYTCALPRCGERVDPSSPDAVLEGKHWMHRRCRRALLS